MRFTASAGTHAIGVTFVRRTAAAPEGPGPTRLPAGSSADGFDQGAEMSVETIQIEGPFNATGPGDTPSRRAIFVCQPESAAQRASTGSTRRDDACATTILSRLARRAYRRPVTDADVRTLLEFYRSGRRTGGFEG